MLKAGDAYKRGKKEEKVENPVYTETGIAGKTCHALPKIKVSCLKYNLLSFSSLKGDVRRKGILQTLPSFILYEAKSHSPKIHI